MTTFAQQTPSITWQLAPLGLCAIVTSNIPSHDRFNKDYEGMSASFSKETVYN